MIASRRGVSRRDDGVGRGARGIERAHGRERQDDRRGDERGGHARPPPSPRRAHWRRSRMRKKRSSAILAAVFFMGGVQLFCVGVLAEYIGRIYDEVRRRPLSLINAVHRAQEVPSAASKEVLPTAA